MTSVMASRLTRLSETPIMCMTQKAGMIDNGMATAESAAGTSAPVGAAVAVQYRADREAFRIAAAHSDRLRDVFVEGVAAKLQHEDMRRTVARYADAWITYGDHSDHTPAGVERTVRRQADILVAAVGLLITALRNGSTSLQAGSHHERNEEVDRAREAWCQALLERGILPFLREALTAPDTKTASAARASSAGGAGRMPQLGYHRPGFSSPDGGSTTGTRPSYSSPDFSSPDYGGPEHPPE